MPGLFSSRERRQNRALEIDFPKPAVRGQGSRARQRQVPNATTT